MKTMKITLTAACLGFALCQPAFAQTDKKGEPSQAAGQEAHIERQNDHITVGGGKVMVVKDDKSEVLDKEMTLTNGMKVMPNGMVMMKDGKTMKLREDDIIMMDGKVDKKDHYVMKDGKLMVVKGGKATAVETETVFDDGTRMTVDGKIIRKTGSPESLSATDRILLDGTVVKEAPSADPGRDTN